MGVHVISLSDVGEGVAEAELIEWHVAVGDTVGEDQLLGVVMTDKAAVEVPSSVLGKVTKLCATVGDVIAVGADLVHLEVDGTGNSDATQSGSSQSVGSQSVGSQLESSQSKSSQSANTQSTTAPADQTGPTSKPSAATQSQTARANLSQTNPKQTDSDQTNSKQSAPEASSPANNQSGKVLAAPSVRQRARELGVNIATVSGSGPVGRVVHKDLDQFTERRANPASSHLQPNTDVNVVNVVGLRRKIAEKMALSKSRIPHITIVEEVDVHYLEELREELNEKHAEVRGKLTILPFVMKSIVEAAREQPGLNARYDDEAGTIEQFGGVHIGVATQTDNGLVVPVIKHAEINSLWTNASEVKRLAAACRNGEIKRDEMSDSTITITSLGALGAVATTPIINHPEVAIVGINKMMIRPYWDGQQFVPRKMMNLSCSFDHRVVDGWDAAVFVQKLKSLLEKPAMLFMSD